MIGWVVIELPVSLSQQKAYHNSNKTKIPQGMLT